MPQGRGEKKETEKKGRERSRSPTRGEGNDVKPSLEKFKGTSNQLKKDRGKRYRRKKRKGGTAAHAEKEGWEKKYERSGLGGVTSSTHFCVKERAITF